MSRRAGQLLVLIVVGVALYPSAAQAHQNPPNCDSNAPTLRISRDRPIVRIGETVTFTVYASNPGATSCDITNAKITLQVPGADGRPVAAQTIIAQGLDLLSNTTERQVGRLTVPINVTLGVTDAVVLAHASGVLHDAPIDHTAEDTKTLGTTVIVAPGIHVEKTGSVPNNVAPQNATYTFTVTNISNPPLPLDNVRVSDSLCPGVQGPISGDLNGDRRLDPTEAWVYTCTMTHPAAGQYNNVVTACAELVLNGKSDKVCDDAPFSITLIAPPPQAAVKPVSVNKAPCTLARANSTTVRARQLNTIRVRVRNVDAGTKVTLTLPGGKKYTAKADKNGLATFRVRPTKSGTASIQATECSDVERLSVKPARRVVAQRAPRVTG
jgi:uncharacterized repeat protein (TIGR01451 family)